MIGNNTRNNIDVMTVYLLKNWKIVELSSNDNATLLENFIAYYTSL